MSLLFKTTVKSLALGIFFSAAILSTSFAKPNLANPLEPEKDTLSSASSLYIGVGPNFQSGDFLVDCPTCTFKGGTKIGWIVGANYETEIKRNFFLGIGLYIDYLGISSSYREIESVPFTSQITGREEKVPIEFRHVGDISAAALGAMPYARISLFKYMFVRAGLGASYVYVSSLKHTKELITKKVTLSAGDIVYPKLEGTNGTTVTLEDGDLKQLNALQLNFVPQLGFNIYIDELTNLSPSFMYFMPLSKMSERGNDFKINSWRICLELRRVF